MERREIDVVEELVENDIRSVAEQCNSSNTSIINSMHDERRVNEIDDIRSVAEQCNSSNTSIINTMHDERRVNEIDDIKISQDVAGEMAKLAETKAAIIKAVKEYSVDKSKEEELREEFRQTRAPSRSRFNSTLHCRLGREEGTDDDEEEIYVTKFSATERLFLAPQASPLRRAAMYEAAAQMEDTFSIYRPGGMIIRRLVLSSQALSPLQLARKNKVTNSFSFLPVFLPKQTEHVHRSEYYYYRDMMYHFLTYYPYLSVHVRTKKEGEYYLFYFSLGDEDFDLFELRWNLFAKRDNLYRPLHLATFQEISLSSSLRDERTGKETSGSVYSLLSLIPFHYRRKIIFNATSCLIWHDLPSIPNELITTHNINKRYTCYHLEMVERTTSLLEQVAYVRWNPTTCFDSEGRRISYYTSPDERIRSEANIRSCLEKVDLLYNFVPFDKREEEVSDPNDLNDRCEVFTQEEYRTLTPLEKDACIVIEKDVFSILHLTAYISAEGIREGITANKVHPVTRQPLPEYLPSVSISLGYFAGFGKETEGTVIIDEGGWLSWRTAIETVDLIPFWVFDETQIPLCLSLLLSSDGVLSKDNYARDNPKFYMHPKLYDLFLFSYDIFSNRHMDELDVVVEINRYIESIFLPSL